jgi:hypothetical protein
MKTDGKKSKSFQVFWGGKKLFVSKLFLSEFFSGDGRKKKFATPPV